MSRPADPDEDLHWIIDSDVPTLMAAGSLSRFAVLEAKKAARAELDLRRLLRVWAAAQPQVRPTLEIIEPPPAAQAAA